MARLPTSLEPAFVPLAPARAPVRHSVLRSADQLSTPCSHRPRRNTTLCAAEGPRKWARVAAGVVGIALGSLLPVLPGSKSDRLLLSLAARQSAAIAAEMIEVPVVRVDGELPLKVLGIKQEDYLSHRELSRRKTTQYSEAEEEIMELEEDEFENKWFHDLQVMWAGIGSVGGIFVLYKGGVLWERWIQEQERKDMEEEIELTGTFIDPRAVRKDEEEEEAKKKKQKKKSEDGDDADSSPPSGSSGPDPSASGPDDKPSDSDVPPDDIDALERLFGKS